MTKKQLIALIIRTETMTDKVEGRPGPIARRIEDHPLREPLHKVAEGDARLIWPR